MLKSVSLFFKENSGISIFCSFAIFLFSAISLVVPSGFSYGAILLVLGSLVLAKTKTKLYLDVYDKLFLLTLIFYVLICFTINIYHSLPASSYDKPTRYLLVIPVYILLLRYPPNQACFWLGLIFGALGAIGIAVYQQLYNYEVSIIGRSIGFLNAIQFGDIAILLAGLLLSCTLCAFNSKTHIFLILLFSAFSLSASVLSFSRGGWLALPLIFYVLSMGWRIDRKKVAALIFSFFMVAIFIVILLPESSYLKNRISVTYAEINAYFQYDSKDYTSISIRFIMWKSGFDAFLSKPIMGWGNFDAIVSAYPQVWDALKPLYNFNNINHLHNEYIDALAKKGLVGFTALMAMYLVPLYYFVGLMRTRQADVMPFAAAGVILILCVMVFGLTQCFLAHNSGTMVFVFYLVIIKAYCRNIVAARMPAAQI